MKKWVLRIAVILVGLIVIVGAGGFFWFQYTIKKSLPPNSGEISLKGLKEDVKIIRDDYGVPHIYAENESDLYFAFGYAIAQDRFWQMEFHRRLGSGRLSEIFGEEFIGADRYFRMMTAAGLNTEVPPELEFSLQSFADGVNAYLDTNKDRLPIEFKLLRYKPESWRVDDYLAILKVVNWGLSSGWQVDVTAAKVLKKVGEERFREAFPAWLEDGPVIVPQETKASSIAPDPTSDVKTVLNELKSQTSTAASNNWVISGKKSVTGKPLLANDTHLGLSNPSVWWEAHLVCPTFEVSGFAILGVPGIPIGHNRYVAWGVTNAMVDDVDFYMEKINPENPRQYLYKDKWEDMRVVEEIIKVKGTEPVKKEILITRHGPIINDIEAGSKGDVLSARWAYTERIQPVKAVYQLHRARNLEEVKEALRYWETPCQNFVFADTNGNIGYWYCATVPIRSKGDGVLPVPGWTGEYEWKGFVPFEKRPHLMNPENGILATANNKAVRENYPRFLGHYWEPLDRFSRIRQLLNDKGKLAVDDFKRMHMDTYCVLASELTPLIIRSLGRDSTEEKAKRARAVLAKWDFVMAKDSVAASLFEVTFRTMLGNLFKDELGEELFVKYIKVPSIPMRAMRLIIRDHESLWIDDVSTSKKETLEDIVARSFEQAMKKLEEKIGKDMDDWKWGRIHQLTFEHVLGKKKPLDWIFNLGPYPVGGSGLTVNKKAYPRENPYNANHGVSMRMIVDFSNMDASWHVLPTGESGQLGSPHHKDQIDLYLTGKYHRAWTDPGDVEKHGKGTLTLKPLSS